MDARKSKSLRDCDPQCGGRAPRHLSKSSGFWVPEFLWWGSKVDDDDEIYIDPEALTQRERESRARHTPKLAKPLPSNGPLFEHFIVVGLNCPESETPEILYQFPPSEIKSVEIPGLTQFCFPSGFQKESKILNPSQEVLLQAKYSNSYVEKSENYFVFVLTTMEREFLYGVCIIKNDVISEHPFDVTGDYDENAIAPRCYCFVSRFPYFKLHFGVLESILDIHLKELLVQNPRYAEYTQIDHRPGEARPKKKKKKIRQRILRRKDQPFPGVHLHTEDQIPAKFKDKSQERSREKENVVHLALKQYFAMAVPKVNVPTQIVLSEKAHPVSFLRPKYQEVDTMMEHWGLPLLFGSLSIDNIFKLVTSILLEKKVVLLSSNLRRLSGVSLGILSLIRPLAYQHVIIPILPTGLYDFVEAPIPFFLGVVDDRPIVEGPKDLIAFNLDSGVAIKANNLPQLPRLRDFKKQLRLFQKEITKTFKKDCVQPYVLGSDQANLCEGLTLIFRAYFSQLFSNFPRYSLTNMTDSNKPITVFLKESFLSDQDKQSKPFMRDFLETQVFFQYCDERLRTLDSGQSSWNTI